MSGSVPTPVTQHGEVVERGDPGPLSAAQIEAALGAFRGPIEQVPPMYSALKHEGRRLYQIARTGGSVERPARPVTIHELDLLSWESPDLCMRVCCSKGTYIRTLVEDIGGALGSCAHVRQLRRTRAGPFDLSQAVSLDRIERVAAEGLAALDSLLIPADAAVGDLPSMALDAAAAKRLCQGQEVPAEGAGSPGTVRLYDADGSFLGLGERDAQDRVRPRRLFNNLDTRFLERLKTFLDLFDPPWYSDHLSYSSAFSVEYHDLIPFPFCEEALDHLAPRVEQVQTRSSARSCSRIRATTWRFPRAR